MVAVVWVVVVVIIVVNKVVVVIMVVFAGLRIHSFAHCSFAHLLKITHFNE